MDNMQPNVYNSCLYVDLSALRDNVAAIGRTLSPGCRIMAVLKGDAYGLGLGPLSAALEPMDEIHSFAVVKKEKESFLF